MAERIVDTGREGIVFRKCARSVLEYFVSVVLDAAEEVGYDIREPA